MTVNTGNAHLNNSKTKRFTFPDILTAFSFIWASQELAQQASIPGWVAEGNLLGWCVTIFATLVLFFPRSLHLFFIMVFSSIVYNVDKLPYVSNHILLETLINITIFLAILSAYFYKLYIKNNDEHNAKSTIVSRDAIFYRLAPVLGAIFVLIYYVIIVSKLNWDFENISINCIGGMYEEAIKRFPFLPLPSGITGHLGAYWIFMVVEITIPVLLTFRKTRYLAFFIGLPFHFLLGLVGHWAFSSFIIALYAMVALPSLLELIGSIKEKFGSVIIHKLFWVFRIVSFGIISLMLVAYLSGNYEGDGPFFITFRFGYAVWTLWYIILSIAIVAAIVRSYLLKNSKPISFASSAPKWLWIMFAVVILNSLSPYLGLKTQTSTAMYSNLRTEGGANNHMFMPALRLFPMNDRLVEILNSNDPKINAMKTASILGDKSKTPVEIYNTYFEFRRAVSESTKPDLRVTYFLDGEKHTFIRGSDDNHDSELDVKYSIWLSKLVYYRPVFQEKSYCLH